MQDIKIIFNVNHSKKEISIICENDSHFNRTWKLKGDIDFEKCIAEALIYVEGLTNKLNS